MGISSAVTVSGHHLLELDEDSYWGSEDDPGVLGARLCGVTNDSPDTGFPGRKSHLFPGMTIRSDGLLGVAFTEELDPETEAMIEELTSKPRKPSRPPKSPRTFLERNSRRLRSMCCRRDYREAHDLVDRLERLFVVRHSLSMNYRDYYQRCWSGLIEQLDVRIRWAKQLLDRLEAIELELEPPYPSIMPVTGTVSHDIPRRYRDKPVLKSRKHKHHKKHSRQRKHARTKTHVHRPALG